MNTLTPAAPATDRPRPPLTDYADAVTQAELVIAGNGISDWRAGQ